MNLMHANNGKRIDILVTDVVMPEMGGKELADFVHNISAETKVLFCSGYTEEAVNLQGMLGAGGRLFRSRIRLMRAGRGRCANYWIRDLTRRRGGAEREAKKGHKNAKKGERRNARGLPTGTGAKARRRGNLSKECVARESLEIHQARRKEFFTGGNGVNGGLFWRSAVEAGEWELWASFGGEVVLPEAEDLPAAGAEGAGDGLVAEA